MSNKTMTDIVGFAIDYGTICTDYNTTYLDRDNDDPQTVACMRKILSFMKSLLEGVVSDLEMCISMLNHDKRLDIDDVASKRFLFYSLEKEITLQSFVLERTPVSYDSVGQWAQGAQTSILIQNDEDGEGVTLYCSKSSLAYTWLSKRLEEIQPDMVRLPQ